MGFKKAKKLYSLNSHSLKQTKNKLMVFNCGIALATLTWHIQYKCVTIEHYLQ